MVHSGNVREATPRRIAGFTLIELMVTLAVAVVLVSIAVPSFQSMLARQRLRAAAEQFRADLDLARTEAIKRNASVRVDFTRSIDGETWCYGLTLGTSCDCTASSGTTVCFLDRTNPADGTSAPLLRVINNGAYPAVTLDADVADFSFNPIRMTLVPRTATFSANDQTVNVVFGNVGRVRICSPAGDNYLYYYEEC